MQITLTLPNVPRMNLSLKAFRIIFTRITYDLVWFFFMSFLHQKYTRYPCEIVVSFSHVNMLMWILCQHFLHQIHVTRTGYFMQIVNFALKKCRKIPQHMRKFFLSFYTKMTWISWDLFRTNYMRCSSICY